MPRRTRQEQRKAWGRTLIGLGEKLASDEPAERIDGDRGARLLRQTAELLEQDVKDGLMEEEPAQTPEPATA